MAADPTSRDVIDDFLAQKSLALVGVSRDGQTGFGNAVRRELAEKGYHLHVVHPEADRIGDVPCAHALAEVAGEVGGVVLVTPPAETEKLVREAVALGVRRVWMQQGAESADAIAFCEREGVAVVHGECILMFAEPTAWFHRAHRWARGVFGELPGAGEVEHEPHEPHGHGSHGSHGAHVEHVEHVERPRTRLERKVLDEVTGLDLDAWPPDEPLITQAELDGLPPVVQRYLRFMGVVGRPRARSFMMRFSGTFLFGGEWVPCECAQYDSRLPVARIFHMRLRVKGIVPTYVRDTYLRGRGHMAGKVLGALTVVDDESEPVTIGECVTYLNDAILMAPSLLLGPEVSWTGLDEGSFEVALTDAGRTVRARVLVDEAGRVTDFSTTDRFYSPPGSKEPPVRAEWRTPVDGWQEHEGRVLPTSASAVWMLATGPLAYARFPFDPRDFELDVPPRGPSR